MTVVFYKPQKALWEQIDAAGFDYEIKLDNFLVVQCSYLTADDYEIQMLIFEEMNVYHALKFDKRLCKRVKIYCDDDFD